MRTARRTQRIPNAMIGLIAVIVIAVAAYLAFSKELPWGSKFTVQAVVKSASNIRTSAPVRIAGVNVGEVTEVEHIEAGEDGVPQEGALITMELEDDALPLHTDATLKLRPRLFLEGNLFVDLRPGSPNAPEVEDGYVFPASQTQVAVQLDQVLTTLQADVRRDLQVLLDEFGNALTKHGGAEGFREAYRSSPGAFRYSSEVNEALLGLRPHDLSDLIQNLDSTVEALAAEGPALQDTVTNLRIVTEALAAEDEALREGVSELPAVIEEGRSAFASLNAAFPPLRAFSREALPGVRETPQTIDEAMPLLRQVRGLVSKPELRGLTADLRPTIPALARLTKRTIPFMEQSRALSSCFNEVVIPWSNMTVNDPWTPATGKVFEELGYSLVGLSGESRSGDGNGFYIRLLAAGGVNTVVLPDSIRENGALVDAVGMTPLPILGGLPSIESSAKTPFRPDVPCETNDPPNLNAGTPADPPDQTRARALEPVELTDRLTRVAKSVDSQLERATALADASRQPARARSLRNDALEGLNKLLGKAYGLTGVLKRVEALAK